MNGATRQENYFDIVMLVSCMKRPRVTEEGEYRCLIVHESAVPAEFGSLNQQRGISKIPQRYVTVALLPQRRGLLSAVISTSIDFLLIDKKPFISQTLLFWERFVKRLFCCSSVMVKAFDHFVKYSKIKTRLLFQTQRVPF